MGKMDLHLHSAYSADGEWGIEALLAECRRQEVKLTAVTDHNSVRGVAEALRYGPKYGVTVVPGIEIDCTYAGRNLHVLGYGIDWCHPWLQELEPTLAKQAERAFPHMVHCLEELAIHVDVARILANTQGRFPCGEDIAEVVLAQPENRRHPLLQPYFPQGARSDMPYLHFYRDFFAQGKVGYVALEYPGLAETVAMIHQSGGMAVLAHPGENLGESLDLLEGIVAVGIDGLEVYSNYHSLSLTQRLAALARQQGLLRTSGSDFHGKNKPTIQVGMCKGSFADSTLIEDFWQGYQSKTKEH